MFKNKRTNQQNAAAIPGGIPRPPQTIINQAPNEALVFLVKAAVCGIGLFIGWYFLLYLIEEMGYKRPERALGWFIFGGAGLLLVSIAVDKTITKYYTLKREFDERIEEIRAERDRSLALTAAQPRPGESRLTEEDSKLCALLRVVMDEAYRHLDKEGQYTRSDVKPWSRTPNQGRQIPGFKDVVTFKMAGDVRQWLTQEGVIKRDEVNLEKYPTFAHFEGLLEERFYTPIKVQKALFPALRNEVSFIEK